MSQNLNVATPGQCLSIRVASKGAGLESVITPSTCPEWSPNPETLEMPWLPGAWLPEGICLGNTHRLTILCQVRRAKEPNKKIGFDFYTYEKSRRFGRKEGNGVIKP